VASGLFSGLEPASAQSGTVYADATSAKHGAPATRIQPGILPTQAVGSDFNPGLLVSDDNFYNGNALDAAGVQAFIQTQNSTCNSGYACLWGYGQSTPSVAVNAYCSSITGLANESAASIIARVGNACGISQKAILVLLQKEQSLVTSSTPTDRSFGAATGFNCPDSAPCDSSYAGFFYQVYNAARQFQIYRAKPTSFNYHAGITNSILYSPNTSCGASGVYIQNAATAGLYDYTPYQPNVASLNNLYGVGDGCSAYGNRNFWRIWSDWFGSPIGQAYDVIQLVGSPYTYLVSGATRFAFMSPGMLAQYSMLGPPTVVSVAYFYSHWTDGVQVQQAIRASDGSYYLVDQNKRYRFSGCAQVVDFGQNCTNLPTLLLSQVDKIPDGGTLTSLVQLPGGTTWLMQGGQRRQVLDPGLLAPYGISRTTTLLGNFSIGSAPVGSPVLGAGLYTNGQGSYRAAATGNYDLTAAAIAGSLAVTARLLDPGSFSALVSAGTLPLRLLSNGRYFVAGDGGWLEVSGAIYGGAPFFTALAAGAQGGLPIVATVTGAHFAKERSSFQTYFISSGMRQLMADQSQITSTSASAGVSSQVFVVADGALDGLAELSNLASGTVIRRSGSTNPYLIDGTRLISIPRNDYVQQLGFSATPVVVTASVFNGFADRSTALDRTVIECAGVSFVANNGEKYAFETGAQSAWAVTPVALADATCALIPTAPQAIGRYLFGGQDGRYWFVSGGMRLQVTSQSARDLLATQSTAVTASNAAIGQLSGGPDFTSGVMQGSVIISPNGSEAYLVDGTQLTMFARWQTMTDLGFGTFSDATKATSAFMSIFSSPRSVLGSVAVSCTGTPYLGIGGHLLPYSSATVQSAWNLRPFILSAPACSRLAVASTIVTEFFRTPDGTVWMAVAGQRHAIQGWPAMNRLSVLSTGFLDVDYEVAKLLPVGAPITG